MSEHSRVFVTGFSALTSTGHSAEETWSALLSGKSGLAEIQQEDLSTWKRRLGGELAPIASSAWLPDRKLMKAIARQDMWGLQAAMQAVQHSQLIAYRDSLPPSSQEQFNEDTGVYVGSPGNKYFQQYDFLPLLAQTNGNMQAFGEQLFGSVHPMWLLRILPNNVLAYTGMAYGFKGSNHNMTNHALGGMQALLEAYYAIQSGQAERAVVVAYDLATEPQALFYYDRLGLISDRHLKPFDAQHDGTLLADGACALVLESEKSAHARGASCYAEIIGGLSSTESTGLFSIQEDGHALAALMERTLQHFHVNVHDLDVIVAHGNGNPKSDISEARAIQNVCGDANTPVTAFKWSMGHTICVSGLLDTLLTQYMLGTGIVPGIANLEHVSPLCAPLNIDREMRTLKDDVRHAMILNRGFAGMNACLLIKSCV